MSAPASLKWLNVAVVVALAATARAYLPTLPTVTVVARSLLGMFAVLLAADAVWPGFLRRRGRFVSMLARLLLVASAVLLLFMAALSGFVLAVVSLRAAAAHALVHGLAAVAASVLWRRRSATRRWLPAALLTLLLANAAMYQVLCLWMWQRPDPVECSAVEVPAGVTRLSDPASPQRFSYPFYLHYVRSEARLFATFKMAGNLTLRPWDVPQANELHSFSLSDPAQPQTFVLPFHGQQMPQHLRFNPARGELLVALLGYHRSRLVLLSAGSDGPLRLLRERTIDFEPHALGLAPDGSRYVLLGVNKEVVHYDSETLETLDEDEVPVWAPVVFNAWQNEGASALYVSLFGRRIAEYDVDRRSFRDAKVVFAGGDLYHDHAAPRIFQTDSLFGAVNEVDVTTMTLIRRFRLPYKPRPVVSDTTRDLLMVGDWWGGAVHFYRLSDLAPLSRPVPVGPYLRDFDYDPARGLLFAGSKCGVYMLWIDELVHP